MCGSGVGIGMAATGTPGLATTASASFPPRKCREQLTNSQQSVMCNAILHCVAGAEPKVRVCGKNLYHIKQGSYLVLGKLKAFEMR